MDKKERYERYKYLTGLSSWHIGSYKDKSHVITVNDGPSGLRKPVLNEFNKQDEVVVSVCMPTPSALAASFDKELVYENGKILAKECLQNNTDVLLAPGVNIKRYVLCGRNFEYFSEDPYLAGIMASCYVNGIESNNVGACVKHYACNSQEHARLINSSEVSLRALNEIYLRVYKYITKYSTPSCIMTSYNRINEEYVNESKYLIQKKLKEEFNFKGLIMSDWVAVSNRWKTINTGLQVEMPQAKMSNEWIDRGYNIDFTDEDLLARDEEIYNAIKKFKRPENFSYTISNDELHEESVKIASKTTVLVKNEEKYFPFNQKEKVLVLGYFANHNRFVGGGSGWVNAYKPNTFIEILDKNNINYEFVQCYDEDNLLVNENDLRQYQNKFDKVVLFMGQYQKDETEGNDRNSLDLDENQIKLLNIVKKVFNDFGSIIITGSVINIEEVYNNSNSILLTYLAGEGQADAIFNNLFGLNNPSGRLPETWISSIKQNPIIKEYLRRDIYHTYYYDDIYVGYRYYDIHNNGFILPFGYGLSYSDFKYENYKYEIVDNKLVVSLEVTNDSDIDGSDVIQVYVGKEISNVYRVKKELKGFEKVHLKAYETKSVTIEIDVEDLGVYREATDKLEVETGTYQVYIALNANNILNVGEVYIKGVEFEKEMEPKQLLLKEIPTKFSFDTPAGFLFDNEHFKKYVKENNLPIELEDFENKYWWIESKPLRSLINDVIFNLTFEQLEGLINYLNSFDIDLTQRINFDDYVEKHIKILKCE